ncbi:D-alanine--D-alanine ligase A (D-alanylalanine synthetase A) (D-Ala-D-Ala ligase A) [Bradyrhizobium sp. ORS 278]|uniref:D-alanine--D-alanine ligase n=1 Tax=Bradyrhizobium sp. (strain ORS 278) TaxID=114615 RepID=DDL_BRASO|nr:D-alanine--D-alanine ligase family protein [Bradyrhizobium sp. ORS 278]A4YRU4.1 RecName: Full=D-alanine--D-alanine ligase; AltName: Full=D-Ala-D-Ala ligase; AltName: Full=D-alanylalanine synthetase [Bradyrhizobium sp. ORS 278]CAL76620.1 D-alanine--D-alanine ligase A (D-alanylalanine synthetase A) (D-Ala-D-Ala ligase A) [Bradyrhizobium sp. ORS 278]
MTSERIRVAILFGGRSAEHDVSRASAANIFRSLDAGRYALTLIGITHDGRWVLADAVNDATSAALIVPADGPQIVLLPAGRGRALAIDGSAAAPRELAFDVIFPVLHGPNGEDGTVQGALELADVAYVGGRVLGSAAAMDKDVAKRLLRDAGLPIVPFVTMTAASPVSYDDAARAVGSSELFVKPANLGSSVGISKTRDAAEFEAACQLALRFDRKILIERCIAPVREIECAVLEHADGQIKASELGEIVPANSHGFYSYEAKYTDANGAALHVPAQVEPAVAQRIRKMATEVFGALCCESLARVDFFVRGDEIYVNEVNTLPGFTNISMYPKMWEAAGLPQPALMDELVAHALARHARLRELASQR